MNRFMKRFVRLQLGIGFALLVLVDAQLPALRHAGVRTTPPWLFFAIPIAVTLLWLLLAAWVISSLRPTPKATPQSPIARVANDAVTGMAQRTVDGASEASEASYTPVDASATSADTSASQNT